MKPLTAKEQRARERCHVETRSNVKLVNHAWIGKHYERAYGWGGEHCGLTRPKWLELVKWCYDQGWRVSIQFSRSSYSKYILIRKNTFVRKVRVATHRPRPTCNADYYLGVDHKGKYLSLPTLQSQLLEDMTGLPFYCLESMLQEHF